MTFFNEIKPFYIHFRADLFRSIQCILSKKEIQAGEKGVYTDMQ